MIKSRNTFIRVMEGHHGIEIFEEETDLELSKTDEIDERGCLFESKDPKHDLKKGGRGGWRRRKDQWTNEKK